MHFQLAPFLDSLRESDIKGTKTYAKIACHAKVFLKWKEDGEQPYEDYEEYLFSWGEALCIHDVLLCCIHDNI